MKEDQRDLKSLFKKLPYLLALIGLTMFAYTIFGKEPPIQSLYWFLVVIASFFLPYIKEITFQDIKLKLEEGLEKQQEAIEDTKEQLEKAIKSEFLNTYENVKRVDASFGEIRDELIEGYQVYLKTLDTDKRREKIIFLNKIYLNDLKISVATLKEQLSSAGYYKGEIDNEYKLELLESIYSFQKDEGMQPDGIFGHNSYKKLVDRLQKNT